MYTVLRGKARLRCLTQSWHSREGHSQRLHSHRCRHSFDANLDWLIRSTKDSCYCLAGFHGCDVHVINGHHSVVKLDTTLFSRAAGHDSRDDQSTSRLGTKLNTHAHLISSRWRILQSAWCRRSRCWRRHPNLSSCPTFRHGRGVRHPCQRRG